MNRERDLLVENQELRRRLEAAEKRLARLASPVAYPRTGNAALERIVDPDVFFSKVVGSAINGVYVYDFDTQSNVYINARYTELTGFTLDQVNDLPAGEFLNLFHPEDLPNVLAHMQAIAEAPTDDLVPLEYRFRDRDGGWMWCLSHDVPFTRDADGRVTRFLGSFVDITRQRRAVQDVDHFAHVAAHDLREPARRILLHADILREDWSPEADEAKECLAVIHGQAERLLDLIAGFRHLTAIGGGARLQRESVPLGGLVEEVLAELGDDLRGHRVQVTVAPLPRVDGYRPLLHSLYRNLVGNVVKHVPPGCRLEVGATPGREGLVLYVHNTGSSVPPDRLDSVLHPARRRDQRGVRIGLGLSICARIVEHHRGRIWVESGSDHVRVCFRLSATEDGHAQDPA